MRNEGEFGIVIYQYYLDVDHAVIFVVSCESIMHMGAHKLVFDMYAATLNFSMLVLNYQGASACISTEKLCSILKCIGIIILCQKLMNRRLCGYRSPLTACICADHVSVEVLEHSFPYKEVILAMPVVSMNSMILVHYMSVFSVTTTSIS